MTATKYSVQTCFAWLWSKGRDGSGWEYMVPAIPYSEEQRVLRIQQIGEYEFGVPARVIIWQYCA